MFDKKKCHANIEDTFWESILLSAQLSAVFSLSLFCRIGSKKKSYKVCWLSSQTLYSVQQRFIVLISKVYKSRSVDFSPGLSNLAHIERTFKYIPSINNFLIKLPHRYLYSHLSSTY